MATTTRRSLGPGPRAELLASTLVLKTTVFTTGHPAPAARQTTTRRVEYDIGAVIGRGGFGVAHRAVQRCLTTGGALPRTAT